MLNKDCLPYSEVILESIRMVQSLARHGFESRVCCFAYNTARL